MNKLIIDYLQSLDMPNVNIICIGYDGHLCIVEFTTAYEDINMTTNHVLKLSIWEVMEYIYKIK